MASATARPLRAALGGLLALAAAMGVGRFVYTPILPAMISALGLTKAEAGWIAAANYVGYLAGAVVAAHSAFSGRARPALLCGLVLSVLTTAAMDAVTGLPAFLIVRAVGGFASAWVLVFASHIVLGVLARAGRTPLAALNFAGVGLGVAASALLISALSAAGADWRGLWLGAGALSLAAAGLAAWLIPPEPAPAQAQASATGQGGPGLGRLAVAYGLFGFGYVITATFLVSIVRDAPQARPLEPYVWLIVGLSAAPSVALWNAVGQRITLGPAFALACVLEALGVALSVLAPNLAGAALAAVLLGGTFMGLTALGLRAARVLSPRPAQALGLMTAAFGVGQIIGPVFAGELAGRLGGLTAPSLTAGALLLVGAGLAATVKARDG